MMAEFLVEWGPAGHGPHVDGPFWIFPLVFLTLIAALVITAIIAMLRRSRRPSATERAKSVLAERFAGGELSAQEYRERLGELD